MPGSKVISDLQTIKALADPLRMAIIRELEAGPASAAMLARRLEQDLPRLSYHLKQLEKHGLVRVSETRTRRNLKERLYEPVATEFHIRHDVGVGTATPGQAEDLLRETAGAVVGLIRQDLERVTTSGAKGLGAWLGYEDFQLTAEECAQLDRQFRDILDGLSRDPGPGKKCFGIGFAIIGKPPVTEDEPPKQG